MKLIYNKFNAPNKLWKYNKLIGEKEEFPVVFYYTHDILFMLSITVSIQNQIL